MIHLVIPFQSCLQPGSNSSQHRFPWSQLPGFQAGRKYLNSWLTTWHLLPGRWVLGLKPWIWTLTIVLINVPSQLEHQTSSRNSAALWPFPVDGLGCVVSLPPKYPERLC